MHRLPALSTDAVLPPDPPELSPREREAVQPLSAQMSTTQIADTLSISINTVRTRVRRALGKFDANGRDEAVKKARARGIVGHPRRIAGPPPEGAP